jgi:hypothetical protein
MNLWKWRRTYRIRADTVQYAGREMRAPANYGGRPAIFLWTQPVRCPMSTETVESVLGDGIILIEIHGTAPAGAKIGARSARISRDLTRAEANIRHP